jgi:ferredoxin
VHVTVDEDVCIGSGRCAELCPNVFDQRDDDGIVVLLLESPPIEDQPDVVEAEKACPVSAIGFD